MDGDEHDGVEALLAELRDGGFVQRAGKYATPNQSARHVGGQQLIRAEVGGTQARAEGRDLLGAQSGALSQRGVRVELVGDVEAPSDRQDDDLPCPLAETGQSLGEVDELAKRPGEVREVQHDAPRTDERAVGVLHLEALVLLALSHRVVGLVQCALSGVEIRRG